MMKPSRSRLTGLAAVVLVVSGGMVHAAAASTTLASTAYGVVDFGDRIAYTVTGAGCRSAAVSVRVVAGDEQAVVSGPVSRPGVDSGAGRCTGMATVPGFAAVQEAGWRQGEAIDIALVSDGESVPLRYQRVEIDAGKAVAGAPTAAAGTDIDTGAYDAVTAMAGGDAIALGRVDVQRIDSIALRLCVVGATPPASTGNFVVDEYRHEAPVLLSLRQDSPTGPALVGPINVAADQTTYLRLSHLGYGGTCWRLLSLPVTGQPVERAPELFFTVERAVPGVFQINSVDFNGTGARVANTPTTSDPAGTETIFDGQSFSGWTQSGCVLRDGAVTRVRNGDRTSTAGCTLTHSRSASNQIIRLEVRRENFYDNGGINVPSEIQLRSAGEYLPGGYFGGYAARWQKLNSWPDWTPIEIVQLGARYIVRVNGRIVTDHTAAAAPNPYKLSVYNQPIFSYRYGAGSGFGNEASTDDVTTPDEWGNVWFRNIRTYQCTSTDDPVCTAQVALNAGQAPRP